MRSLTELADILDKIDVENSKFTLISEFGDTEIPPKLVIHEQVTAMLSLLIEKYGFTFVFDAMCYCVTRMKPEDLNKIKPVALHFIDKEI